MPGQFICLLWSLISYRSTLLSLAQHSSGKKIANCPPVIEQIVFGCIVIELYTLLRVVFAVGYYTFFSWLPSDGYQVHLCRSWISIFLLWHSNFCTAYFFCFARCLLKIVFKPSEYQLTNQQHLRDQPDLCIKCLCNKEGWKYFDALPNVSDHPPFSATGGGT